MRNYCLTTRLLVNSEPHIDPIVHYAFADSASVADVSGVSALETAGDASPAESAVVVSHLKMDSPQNRRYTWNSLAAQVDAAGHTVAAAARRLACLRFD